MGTSFGATGAMISDTQPLIECIPNFSTADEKAISSIAKAINSVDQVYLLHKDPGPSANRTVFTFMGPPEAVVEAAFRAVEVAIQHIDMTVHKGAHPRIGAADVIPFVPIHNITIEQVIVLAHRFGERIGNELNIPGYYYEAAATQPERTKLEWCRAGQYEGLANKMKLPNWQTDFGPQSYGEQVAKTGATLVSARQFLIAWNINLDTKDVSVAHLIARQLRESNGGFKNVKAIGWYLQNFDLVQVSMNLTDFRITGLYEVFEKSKTVAEAMNVKVTGSELVGLIPEECMRACAQAGGWSDDPQWLDQTVEYLGLSELEAFLPDNRVLERVYRKMVRFDQI